MPKFNFADLEKAETPKKTEILTKKPKSKTPKKQKEPEIITIDFDIAEYLDEIAQTSDFKRLIYRSIVGTVHRGSEEDLNVKLSKLLKKVKEV